MTRFATWLLACMTLALPGCAYKFKDTGHRDLDRSIRFCDQCCAYTAIGAIWAGANGALMWLNSTTETDDRQSTWDKNEPKYQPVTIEQVRSIGESI